MIALVPVTIISFFVVCAVLLSITPVGIFLVAWGLADSPVGVGTSATAVFWISVVAVMLVCPVSFIVSYFLYRNNKYVLSLFASLAALVLFAVFTAVLRIHLY